MELTRKQVIENLQDLKETGVFPYTKKDGSVVTEEYIDYAISSLKTDEAYQLMYEGGEIFTKADMVAMLTGIQLDIQEVNTAPQFLTDDNVKDFRECVDTIIQQKIDALKMN